MRPSAIFPALCALAALILALLCLFAGSSRGFLPNAEIATINTSRIGYTQVFDTDDGDGSLLSDLGNTIESGLNNLTGDLTDGIAEAIGIHDFYKAHIMNYCEGFFEPNATAPHVKRNVTFCSKRNPLFHFDLDGIVENELINGTSLVDLQWPEKIRSNLKMLKAASRAMFVFYCLGIAFAGIGVITSVIGVIGGGRLSALGNFVIFGLGFICLGIASIISTVVAVRIVNTINKEGSKIGLSASKGSMFLGLTWASVGVMALGSLAWIFECIIGRRRSKSFGEKP